MSEDGVKKSRNVSKIFRAIAFVILVGMLILAVIAQFTTPDTPEEVVEATVQAAIQQRLTEVVVQTGTPNPTALRSTIDASVDATLTQIAAGSATPVPTAAEPETPEGVPGFVLAIWNFIAAVFKSFWGIIVGLWNFAGRGGVVIQVICCVIPALAIIVGIANDR